MSRPDVPDWAERYYSNIPILKNKEAVACRRCGEIYDAKTFIAWDGETQGSEVACVSCGFGAIESLPDVPDWAKRYYCDDEKLKDEVAIECRRCGEVFDAKTFMAWDGETQGSEVACVFCYSKSLDDDDDDMDDTPVYVHTRPADVVTGSICPYCKRGVVVVQDITEGYEFVDSSLASILSNLIMAGTGWGRSKSRRATCGACSSTWDL